MTLLQCIGIGAVVGIVLLIVALLCFGIYYQPSIPQNLNWYEQTMTPYYGVAESLPISENKEQYKIAVFMVATPEIANYAKYTLKMNEKWCSMHSYDFFSYTEKAKGMEDLPINFSKIQYSIDLLKTDKYQYVMYIDADAIVINLDYDVRNLINTYMSKSSIMFSEDCYGPKECSKPDKINSGVFIVKNNTTGSSILKYWIDSSRGKCKKYVNVFPNCQLIFTNCVVPAFKKTDISIIPFNLMNGFKSSLLIKHAMAQSEMTRVSNIKNIYFKEIEQNFFGDRVQVY